MRVLHVGQLPEALPGMSEQDDALMKRIRYRGKQNPTCMRCQGPITYASQAEYSKRRCPPCTKAHNNERDKINANRRDVAAWSARMTQTAKRIGPT